MTEKAKNYAIKQHCFEPNLWSNLHLVNFNRLTSYTGKIVWLSSFLFIRSSGFGLMYLSHRQWTFTEIIVNFYPVFLSVKRDTYYQGNRHVKC